MFKVLKMILLELTIIVGITADIVIIDHFTIQVLQNPSIKPNIELQCTTKS